jgi:hypothetical protein
MACTTGSQIVWWQRAALELQKECRWEVAIATHGCFSDFVEVRSVS